MELREPELKELELAGAQAWDLARVLLHIPTSGMVLTCEAHNMPYFPLAGPHMFYAGKLRHQWDPESSQQTSPIYMNSYGICKGTLNRSRRDRCRSHNHRDRNDLENYSCSLYLQRLLAWGSYTSLQRPASLDHCF